MIVRFISDNHEDYEDYREWTAGYLEVPSIDWLNEKIPLYKDAIRDLLKKYDLYSDKTEFLVANNKPEDLIFSIQYFIEDEDNYPKDFKDYAILGIKGIYCLIELVDYTFYEFVKRFPEAKDVHIIELDSQGIDKWGSPGLYCDLYDRFKALGLDPERVNDVNETPYKDMLTYIESVK